MPAYPNEPITVATAVQSYSPAGSLPDGVAAAMVAAGLPTSPVDKIVQAFEALRAHVAVLEDEAAVGILAGAAELITLYNFHGKQSEALAVRDAAIARLEALV